MFTGCRELAVENGIVVVGDIIFDTAQPQRVLQVSTGKKKSKKKPVPRILPDGAESLPLVAPSKGVRVDQSIVVHEIVYCRSDGDGDRPSFPGMTEIGGKVLFGEFPTHFWDTREPMEWVVLEADDDSMLLAASEALFYIPWWRAGVYSSRMDRILNTVFLETAFTEDEQRFLLPCVQGETALVSALQLDAGSAKTCYARAQERYYAGITVTIAD